MTDWRLTTLGRACEDSGGFIRTGPFGSQLHQSDYVDDPTGTPVVMPKDMRGGRIDFTSIARINQATADRLSHHLLAAGDIVLSRRGDVGRSAWVAKEDLPALCGTGSMRIHAVEGGPVQREYLRYFMRSRSAIDYLESQAIGATMPNLNAGIVAGLPLAVPPAGQQRIVAEILGGIDDLIENNRRRVGLLEQMAQAIYHEWFIRFRYPGHEDVTLVDSSLGPIPEGWRVARLDEVADVNRSSRPPLPGELLRYLDISCLGDRYIGSLAEVEGSRAPGRARRVVGPGDVVWSMVRPNRRAHALLVDPGSDWIASTGLAVLSATRICSSLLFENVSSQKFSDYLVSQEGGAAYPAVKPKAFEMASLLVPTAQIDQLFDDTVAPQYRKVWTLREQRNILAVIRDTLLPKLVSGQIDVSHLDLSAAVESVA